METPELFTGLITLPLKAAPWVRKQDSSVENQPHITQHQVLQGNQTVDQDQDQEPTPLGECNSESSLDVMNVT